MRELKRHAPHPSKIDKTWCGKLKVNSMMLESGFSWDGPEVCSACYARSDHDAAQEAKLIERLQNPDFQMKKRQVLVQLATHLKRILSKSPDFQVAVVVTTTIDGEFVGVASNVDVNRTQAILQAAATPIDHTDHPDLAG